MENRIDLTAHVDLRPEKGLAKGISGGSKPGMLCEWKGEWCA